MPTLEPALKQLRLSGILDSMEIRNKQAIEDGIRAQSAAPRARTGYFTFATARERR